MITISDFKKVELRIAKVLEAKDHPNADRLLVLTLDVGGRTKQVVAGIKGSYAPDQLVGRHIVVVDNLEPSVIRGVESQGMILAATDASGVFVIRPDRDMVPGSPVS